jgi:uncharacterized protein YbjT (DUF2867 family)
MKPTVAVAGATGFVGRWFINTYKHKYRFVALTRRKMIDKNPDPDVEWRQVELYSLSSTSEALKGVDYALYLVHSMIPSTRLNQSSFDDTDILLADNFVRAAEDNNLKQIMFMGGILPKDTSDLSRHLRSRYEVEQTLSSRSVPLTSLRAGIIVGPGGSSFRMVENLVRSLPVMLCPKWTLSRTQPVGLDDTLNFIDYCMGNVDMYNQSFDIGGSEITTYLHMMEETAELMGKKRIIFSVPFFSPGLSKGWVALFTNSSRTLVSPLIESLRHEMVVGKNKLVDAFPNRKSYKEAARKALFEKESFPSLPDSEKEDQERNTVRSVQRLPNPGNHSAIWVARRYQTWLPRFFRYLVKVDIDQYEDTATFRLFNIRLLKLYYVKDRSDNDRQLFYIVDGILVKRKDYGWLEFRRVLNGNNFICAIHEFVPALPWFLYIPTQATIHLMVMHYFGLYLKKLQKNSQKKPKPKAVEQPVE